MSDIDRLEDGTPIKFWRTMPGQVIYIVKYGNYYPFEVDDEAGFFARREDAEKRAEQLGGMWEVAEVRLQPEEVGDAYLEERKRTVRALAAPQFVDQRGAAEPCEGGSTVDGKRVPCAESARPGYRYRGKHTLTGGSDEMRAASQSIQGPAAEQREAWLIQAAKEWRCFNHANIEAEANFVHVTVTGIDREGPYPIAIAWNDGATGADDFPTFLRDHWLRGSEVMELLEADRASRRATPEPPDQNMKSGIG